MKLNHVLVLTRDIKVLSQFLIQVIGLEEGERPPFPFAGSWFYSEGQALIHAKEAEVHHLGRGVIDHVALTGSDYDKLIENLQGHQIHYVEKDVPFSGERQVFVSAPDGLVIEIQFPEWAAEYDPKPYL